MLLLLTAPTVLNYLQPSVFIKEVLEHAVVSHPHEHQLYSILL